MEQADTRLLTRMDSTEVSGIRHVPEQVFIIAINRQTRRTEEYRPGMAVPASATLSCDVYCISGQTRTATFAAHGAISCTTQNGGVFQPGFCFSCGLRFISPLGVSELLRQRMSVLGHMPDNITLDDLYTVMEPSLTAACRKTAVAFSGEVILPYAHWHRELNSGVTFAQLLERELLPVFNALGFRLELGSLQISGLAPVPAA